MSIDSRLVGVWTSTQPGQIEITTDGEMFTLSPSWAYELSSDDSTMTQPGTKPLWQVTRLTGQAGTPLGLWERFETNSYGDWREEWLYRADGTFTYHFTLNGAFDSEGIGTFTYDATHISSKERAAAITTDSNGNCIIAAFFDPVLVGTYSVSADDTTWTFHGANGDFVYTRVP